MEVGVQTDLFVDRPATPIYVPAKTGADAFTQIQPGDVSVLIKLLVRYFQATKSATTIIISMISFLLAATSKKKLF